MTQRITEKQLENLVTWINELTGSPVEYRNKETGKINIGHFTLSHAYGGVCVHRIVNEGGGCSTPIVHGHVTKRELYNEIHAFIKGLEFAKRQEA